MLNNVPAGNQRINVCDEGFKSTIQQSITWKKQKFYTLERLFFLKLKVDIESPNWKSKVIHDREGWLAGPSHEVFYQLNPNQNVFRGCVVNLNHHVSKIIGEHQFFLLLKIIFFGKHSSILPNSRAPYLVFLDIWSSTKLPTSESIP